MAEPQKSYKYLLETVEGKKWNVEYDHMPSNEELNRTVEELKSPGTITQSLPKWVTPLKQGAELTGLIGGGALGTPFGPVGQAVGAGLGYSGMKNMAEQFLSMGGYGKQISPTERGLQVATDVPMGMATEMGGQIAPKFLSALGKGITYPWGAYTGSGSRALGEAYKGKPGLTEFMRGQGNEPELVKQAKSGLESLIQERNMNYSDLLSKIKGNQTVINPGEISNAVKTTLKDFSLNTATPTIPNTIGKPIWANTRFSTNRIAQKEMETAVDTINKWTDYSPRGVDELKQALDNLYKRSQPEASTFIVKLRNRVKDVLVDKVPEYKQMTSQYKTATEEISEISRDLSLGDLSTKKSALSKLLNTMKKDDNFTISLLSKLDEKSGGKLIPSLAGMQMQSYIPTSLVGRMGGMYEIFQGLSGLSAGEVAGILASSPRLTGEFMNIVGKVLPYVQKGSRYAPQVIKTLTEE